MQIKELEEALGAVLFERSPRKVTLTKFGEEAAPRVRDILSLVDELGDFARASRDRLVGRLRIGMIPTVAPDLLPKVIANLARMHPELDIHVRETVTPKLSRSSRKGGSTRRSSLCRCPNLRWSRSRCSRRHFLLVRPGEDEGTPVPSSKALRAMRLLLLEEGHCFRDQALSFCNMHSSPPREVLDASSLSTLVQMVSAGIGVTLIPEMAVAVETRSASVSVARFKNRSPREPSAWSGARQVLWPDSSCNFPRWFLSPPPRCASSTSRDRHRAMPGLNRHSGGGCPSDERRASTAADASKRPRH